MLATLLKKRQVVAVEDLPVRGSPAAFPGQGAGVILDDGLTDIPAGGDMLDGAGILKTRGTGHAGGVSTVCSCIQA